MEPKDKKEELEFLTREIVILRQSQSKLALEYVSQMGITVTVEELQRITDVFVECCLVKMNKDLKNRLKKLDEWILNKQNEDKQLLG